MISKRAKWIGLNFGLFQVGIQSPALQLRKIFTLKSNDVTTAECEVCGLGCYCLFVNGERIGNDVLSPAMTDYSKRVLYVRYDIKKYLRFGENVIAIKLGDGYYNQTTDDVWLFHVAPWRNEKRCIFDLKINGESVCVSDRSWKCTLDGATTHSAIRTGENYDARKEDAWKEIGYDDCSWKEVNIVTPPGGKLELQKLPPIRECEVLKAVALHKTERGWVYDFGKNIAGYVSIQHQGKEGEKAILKYSERFDGKEIDQKNIGRYVKSETTQQDSYIFKGDGVESWKPEFVYHGFQYVELSGLSVEPTLDTLTAYFVHTDLRKKADFRCSNELLNWIYQAGITSVLACTHGFPEDCPHREKNGWTGDAAIASDYAVCNFEMQEFYKKWLVDVCDTQRESGQLCGIAPTSGWGYHWGCGPAWDFALFALPDALYRETGDTDCIDLVYEAAKRYIEYAEYYDEDGTVLYGLWDWLAPTQIKDMKPVDNRLSDTCYYMQMLRLLAKFAKIKGIKKDEALYTQKAERVKRAIYEKYVDGDKVDNCGQGAYAFILYYGIVEGEQEQRLLEKLVQTIEKDEYRIQVGIMGLKAVLHTLSAHGRTDVAYKMINRFEYPSFGYWKANGATSLWETWEGELSRNHQMYGDVLYWMFRHIAGIQNDAAAYRKVTLRPYFYDNVCSASAKTETVYGEISFCWEYANGLFCARIVVPDGVEAQLVLPNGIQKAVKTGVYEYRV